jgi:hypothetical protein
MSRTSSGRLGVLLGCLLVTRAGAQVADAGRLAGTVIVEGERPGAGVRRALVTASFAGGTLQVASDDDGHFALTGLPAGRFTLTAEKPGFVKTFYGSKRIGQPPGLPIALAEGQVVDDLRLPLVRGAVLAGTVRDEWGNGVGGAQVTVLMAVLQGGLRRFVAVPNALSMTTSADQGTYRLYGLPPGEYVVRAGAAGRPATRWSASAWDNLLREAQRPAASPAGPSPEVPVGSMSLGFAPAASTAESAQLFTLGAGQERDGVDIAVGWHPLAHVSGVAIGPDGQPMSTIMVGLASVDSGSLYMSPGAIRSDAQGHFSLTLGEGQWMFYGRGSEQATPPPGALPWSTLTPFTVAGDRLENLVMQFEAGVRVTGRILFDGRAAPMRADTVRVSLVPVSDAGLGMAPPPAVVAPDGTFTFSGVGRGAYRPSVATTAPWVLRSALAGSRDVLDAPLEVGVEPVTDLAIHVTDTPTELGGRLLDQLGRPAPEFSVVVFPADRALWMRAPRRSTGLVRIATDGSYHVSGLPPGEYLLAAVADVSPRDLEDQSLLEELAAHAVTVRLAEGEHKTQDLRLGGA